MVNITAFQAVDPGFVSGPKQQPDLWASQVALVVKNLTASAEDARVEGLIPGSRKSPGIGNGNPLQYSCPKKSMDRGAWQGIHGIADSQIQLSTEHTHTGSSAIQTENTALLHTT